VVAGFAALALGSVFVRGVGFLASLVLIRAVGPGEFGAFTVGLTLAMLFGLCVNPGVDDFLVREIAGAPEDAGALVGDAVLLRLAALPLGLLAGAALDAATQAGGMYLFLAVFGAGQAYLLLMGAILRGRRRMRQQALLLSLHMGMIGVGTIGAALLTHSVVWVAAVYAAATVVALVQGYVLLARLGIRPRYRWRPARLTRLVRASVAFGVTLVGVLLLDRQTLLYLDLMRGHADAAGFGSVYNLALALSHVPMAAAAAALPVMTRLARQSAPDFEIVARNLVRYTVMLAIAAAAALHLLAPMLVPRLFGPDYEPAVPVLRIVAFSIPPWFLSLVLITVLEAAHQQRSGALSVLQALVVASPVAVLAIWLFGLQGAAVAYVGGHVVLMVLLLGRTQQMLRRQLSLRPGVVHA
jgi:O-antigen/teichoic acid export membrane protein